MVQTKTERILEIQKSYFSLLKDCFKEQYHDVLSAGGDSEAGIINWCQGKTHDEIIYVVKRRLGVFIIFGSGNEESFAKI